jgi:hypothetical protein
MGMPRYLEHKGVHSLGIESRTAKSVKAPREANASAFPSFLSRQKVAIFQPCASQPPASSSSLRPCEQPFWAKKWNVSFRHHRSAIQSSSHFIGIASASFLRNADFLHYRVDTDLQKPRSLLHRTAACCHPRKSCVYIKTPRKNTGSPLTSR